MPAPHPIIARLAEQRRERGIPQWSMATLLSVSTPTFAGWEQGRHEPHLDRLIDWAALLGLRFELAPMFHAAFHDSATCGNAAGMADDLPELEAASSRVAAGTLRTTAPAEETADV